MVIATYGLGGVGAVVKGKYEKLMIRHREEEKQSIDTLRR